MAFEQRLMRNIVAPAATQGGEACGAPGAGCSWHGGRRRSPTTRRSVLAATFGDRVLSRGWLRLREERKRSFPPAADFARGRAGRRRRRSAASRWKRAAKTSSFGLNSYDIACLLGDLLRARLPQAGTVDVRRPDATVQRRSARPHLRIRGRSSAVPAGCRSAAPGAACCCCQAAGPHRLAGRRLPDGRARPGGRRGVLPRLPVHLRPRRKQKVQAARHRTVRRYLPQSRPCTWCRSPTLQVRIKEAARGRRDHPADRAAP